MKKKCEKNCCHECSSCRKYQEKAFELEVDEELEQERLTNWWKKYHLVMYISIAVILLTTIGTEAYQTMRQKIRLHESDLFEQAIVNMNTKNTDQAIENLMQLIETGKTGYKTLGQIELADLYMSQGQKEQALKVWQDTIDSTHKNDPLHYVAIMSFVGYQMDAPNALDLIKVLEPALQHPQFQGLATEIAALIYKSNNQNNQAKDVLNQALSNTQLANDTRSRLESILSSLGD